MELLQSDEPDCAFPYNQRPFEPSELVTDVKLTANIWYLYQNKLELILYVK